jgi:hypothetical protein
MYWAFISIFCWWEEKLSRSFLIIVAAHSTQEQTTLFVNIFVWERENKRKRKKLLPNKLKYKILKIIFTFYVTSEHFKIKNTF